NVQTAISDLQKLYQQATLTAGPQANGAYFGSSNTTANTGSMFAPNYRSPYSAQMNVGFQRELHPGTVVSVDYIRNVGLHTLLGIDANRVGDARFLDTTVAQNAISATLAQCGVATIDLAIAACPGLHPTGGGAVIGDFAGNGLGGGLAATGGLPAGPGTLAFAGKDPNFGQILLLEPIGRSVYNGLDVVLKTDLKSPLPFIHRLNGQ